MTADTATLPMNPFTLRFPRGEERAFIESYDRRYARYVRIAALLGAIVYAVVGVLDLSLGLVDARLSLLVRPSVCIILVFSALWLLGREAIRPHTQLVMASLLLIGGLGVEVMVFSGPSHPTYLTTAMMQVICFGIVGRVRFVYLFWVAAILLVTISMGALTSPVALDDEPLTLVVTLAMGMSVALLPSYLLERQVRLEYQLSRYVQTLEGLLPICAGCKKIREDGADSSDPRSWTAIESYISRRTPATFTHGLCPVCRVKLYGPDDEDAD